METETDLVELQRIVQAAYDEHGILATPSYAVEAGAIPGKGKW